MRGFGELESAVMVRMWAAESSLTVREVLEQLRDERDLAYTTVMTIMDNLHRKGWLTRERDGRAYRYSTVGTREEYTAALMREALSESTDRQATLVHFLDQLDTKESDAVRRALRAVARKARR